MSNSGLDFDDFDLDLLVGSDANPDNVNATTGPSGTGNWNSSSSICCSIFTNLTEDCTWCNTCD